MFSGDLTQTGHKDEFAEIEHRLVELWNFFSQKGFTPDLVMLPGNHDVERPPVNDTDAELLSMWFDVEPVRANFFSASPTRFRQVVDASLLNYRDFIDRVEQSGLPVLRGVEGLLPGDQLITLTKGPLRIGLVTLNSTWLQIDGKDYQGRLSVDLQQIHCLHHDIESWRRSNDFNLIATHHPTDWLHPTALANWNGEISPPGRYDLHLFGHMHIPFTLSTATSGSATRHTFQAASLFGMEGLANGDSRVHGYSLVCLEHDADSRKAMIWPRLAHKGPAGGRKFIANTHHFDLEDDRYLELSLPSKPTVVPPAPASKVAPAVEPSFKASTDHVACGETLKPLQYHLTSPAAHQHVRRVEQKQFQEEISDSRVCWIIAEWGLASDEFIAASLNRSGTLPAKVYRLDASDFKDRDSFTAELAHTLKASFATICDALADVPTALVILDDIPVGLETRPGAISIERDVEMLTDLLLDFAPELRVVLRSRVTPRDASNRIVALSPFDEADLKVYLGDHDRGGSALTELDTVGMLFRLTNGYPIRVDASLKELAVVSLDELASSNDDFAQAEVGASAEAPLALQRAILDLSDTQEGVTRRSLELLKALAAFPHGAEFARVKRFYGPSGFYPADAAELQERALITVNETPEVGEQVGKQATKILVVPRPVRDYLRDNMADGLVENLNLKAADILFGSDWMTGSKRWPGDLNYASASCRNADIANAAALITRLFRHYRSDPEARETVALVSLAASFANSLNRGCHYTSTSNFCQDILPMMGDDHSREKKGLILSEYAEALRMLGSRERAKVVGREVLDYPLSKSVRQSALVDLALALGQDPEAIAVAEQILKINKNNSHGYQARSIIIQAEAPGPERTKSLRDLRDAAKRRKFDTVASNIGMILASETDDDEGARAILSQVAATSATTKDFWNAGRAVLELARRKIDAGETLTPAELARLISYYQFVLSERVPWMLNKCHRILWHAFEQNREVRNLLTLFRYSSIIWRLRGDDELETEYLAKLQTLIGRASPLYSADDPLLRYYSARTAVAEISSAASESGQPRLVSGL